MIDYEISNLTGYRLPQNLIKKTIGAFSRLAKIKKSRSLSLAFIAPASIRKWNRLYRGRDKATDVLSFAGGGIGEHDDSLGEILICPDRARCQAKEYGWPLDQEIARLLVHGLAHLLGYDHENVSAKKAQEMELFEAKILQQLQKHS